MIDNYCPEVQAQLDRKGIPRDDGSKYMRELATAHRPWLKYVAYDKKLSHWNAKNEGIKAADGEFLFFCDSHCVPSRDSLYDMFRYFQNDWTRLNGTLHMPISYMLERPGLELIYKLVVEWPKGVVHYSFTRFRTAAAPYSVPCMSTCGMMMHRSLYDELGGWPTELGIYGGGEHFINFTLAVLGKTVNIWPGKPLYHYAAPRGYHWNYGDYHRNRCIATYIFGGEALAYRYIMNIKGDDLIKESIFSTVTGSSACRAHHDFILKRKKMTIEAWLKMHLQTLPDDMLEVTE